MKFPQKLRQKRRGGADLLYINWKQPDGSYKREYLGRYDSEESHQEYERRKAIFVLNGCAAFDDNAEPTIAELVVQFLEHAKIYYRKNGRSTGTAEIFQNNLKILCNLYGALKTSEFDFSKLESIQRKMDEEGNLTRKEINRRIGRIKQVFKWGVLRKLVPREVAADLAFVASLRKGRCRSIDPPKVVAVPIADVEATLAELSSVVGAMVRVQLLTGMRPGEIRLMRPRDLDVSGDLWIYTPSEDKTEHRRADDCRKKIPLGPKSQAILTSFLVDRAPDDYLFRPADAAAETIARRSATRRSKLTPSRRRKLAVVREHPKQKFLPFYMRSAYRHAIQRAARRAGVAPWKPHQLRHTAATEIERRYGWRQAQSALGHASVDTTKIYVDENFDLACQISRERG